MLISFILICIGVAVILFVVWVNFFDWYRTKRERDTALWMKKIKAERNNQFSSF